jgi:hypothetical protein
VLRDVNRFPVLLPVVAGHNHDLVALGCLCQMKSGPRLGLGDTTLWVSSEIDLAQPWRMLAGGYQRSTLVLPESICDSAKSQASLFVGMALSH